MTSSAHNLSLVNNVFLNSSFFLKKSIFKLVEREGPESRDKNDVDAVVLIESTNQETNSIGQ